MKAFVSAVAIFLAICLIAGIHTYVLTKTTEQVTEHCVQIERLTQSGNPKAAVPELMNIRKILDKKKLWAELTLPTVMTREVNSVFERTLQYALLGKETEFWGEFVTFRLLVEHIPMREGLTLGEIL